MGTLREVFEWSKGLPGWESDAIRRIFEKVELSDQDLDDLLALLKTSKGILDKKGRTARRLTTDQIPVTPTEGSKTILKTIKDVQNVNAIASGQQLQFAAGGLTVIYGANGSGKSGYSRILKRACRARDGGEKVLSNVFAAAVERGTPQAVFEFETEGRPQSAGWKDGTPCDEALSAIAVFDNRSARIYLDKEHDVAYIPYGLGIFSELAKMFGAMRDRLEKEAVLYTTDLAEFSDLVGDTAVGKLIASLSSTTSPDEVIRLAFLSEEEKTRLDTLEKSLRESDPKRKAETLRRLKTRIDRYRDMLAAVAEAVTESAIAQARGLDRSFMTAQEATRIAANALFEKDDLLPGTGGQAWKELFRAAKKFSESDAYREQPFPVVSEGARCVLCQQTLKEGAPRLSRFSSFIQQETEKTAREAQEKVDQAQKQIAAIRLDVALSDEALLTEIQELQESLPQRIRDFIEALTQRKTHLLLAMQSHSWTAAPILPPNPMPDIAALSARLASEAAELERAAVDNERKKVESEFRELAARKRFSSRKAAVLAAIDKSQMYRKLQTCIRATDTTAISKKSTELQQERITADLTAALNTEFAVLGAKSLRVILSPRTERGKPLQKLKLDLPSPAGGAEEISQILSEGEQRILAIASFLAEASLVHHGSGLVFDDPVSSLDHNYRHLVARRLVAEAAKRQVIVFTHDIFFLVCLREACAEQAVPFFPQNLVFQEQRFGIVRPDLPFEGKSAASRVKSLRDLHQRAEKLNRTGEIERYEEMIRFGYGRLRDSWERMVEEILLGEVVLRFRRGVETQRLRQVLVDDSDVKTIHFGMAKCSQYAHDTAREAQIPVPIPDEFRGDLEELDKYITATSERAKAVGKERRALLDAPKA
jgi:energy-coupling factor transporter ATP-binding protein EcfA2